MRKFYIGFILFFLVYSITVIIYLLYGESTLPNTYIGSPADPATFMTSNQLETATIYSRIKYLIFFVGVPWEWAIYIIILALGFSTSFAFFAQKISKKSLFIQSGVFVFLISLLVALLQLPLSYYSYKLSSEYGINVQPFNLWFIDKGKNFLLGLLITIPIVWILYKLIRHSEKKWWFWIWVISIPFMLLMYFLQPVVIDPLFNDYEPLQDQVLKEEIMELANKAEIPIDNVYQVNMSEKTTALNAYVTGIGSSARIVLWDTTLEKLNNEEILFIMAHEMGHYTYHHIYWNLLGTILSLLVILYIIFRLTNWLILKYGHYWKVNSIKEINSLPLILLLFSIISFIILPIENGISREAEKAADAYAINMTENKEAAISAFHKLAIESLGDPNPPELVKIFLGSHPAIVERIQTINE